MQKNVVVILLFAIVIALFAILNAGAIPVNLIFAKVQISAALVILISAAIGAIIVYSFDAIALFKHKKQAKEADKKALALQEQLTKTTSELEITQEALENQRKENDVLSKQIETLKTPQTEA